MNLIQSLFTALAILCGLALVIGLSIRAWKSVVESEEIEVGKEKGDR